MLTAPNREAILATQPKEIDGLQCMGMFDIRHNLTKPPKAHILSSIWSY
jgi:hypothetical protein